MSFLQSCNNGLLVKPELMVIHGNPGTGKSSLSSGAPKNVFFDFDKGTKNLDVVRAPDDAVASYEKTIQAIESALDDNINGVTFTFDNATNIEKLIYSDICNRSKADHISDKSNDKTGFGNGYKEAYRLFTRFLDLCDELIEKGAFVIIIAHTMTERFNDPITGESFDRFELALHKAKNGQSESCADILKRVADAVLFIDELRAVTTEKEGLSSRTKVTGGGDRVVRTQGRPAFTAKNRHGMPEKITLNRIEEKASIEDIKKTNEANFRLISQYIPFYNQGE